MACGGTPQGGRMEAGLRGLVWGGRWRPFAIWDWWGRRFILELVCAVVGASDLRQASAYVRPRQLASAVPTPGGC